MNRLPHGLTEPLHLLEPFPWWTVAAVFTGAALAWVWWRMRRQRPVAAPPPPPPPPGSEPSIWLRIAEIVDRFALGDRRQGCHELSELARTRLEATTGEPYTTWTAAEVRRRRGDEPLARFLTRLAKLQFGREEPSSSDFARAAKHAARVLGATSPEGDERGAVPGREGRGGR